jgi:hypothetical protein
MTSKYLKEKSVTSELEVDLQFTRGAMRELKAHVAEVESKGGVYMQAREAALSSVDGKIRDAERQLQQWFKTEIPRLLTGLPINEEDYGGDGGSAYDLQDALSALDMDSDQHQQGTGGDNNFQGSKWSADVKGRGAGSGSGTTRRDEPTTSFSRQRPYALVQALCTSKATQNKVCTELLIVVLEQLSESNLKLTFSVCLCLYCFVQLETTVHTLQEKNAALRERVMELTGVVTRWKEELTSSTSATATVPGEEEQPFYFAGVRTKSGSGHGGEQTEARANRVTLVKEAHENEVSLRNTVGQQRSRVEELEVLLVEAQGQASHWEEREGGLRGMLEALRRSEVDLKLRAAEQVSRVKQVSSSNFAVLVCLCLCFLSGC